ncbi:hypothetical protein TESG_02372 [Trichophyton tonsurans CBS 112818]|uniref:Uncharacterized protein n=2 Tax=Trichophyton TaxID=5550 RepID=F2PKL6_TRIEC|nr:hypothetical protein TESG_02372 [Trichophyton tonsurans CBS 112818]EGE02434.1 hypothetical protein TEQG_08608 [Trichophyton equinum CBS 127.97]
MAVVLFPGQTATLDGLVVKLVKKAVGSEVRYARDILGTTDVISYLLCLGLRKEPAGSLTRTDQRTAPTPKLYNSSEYHC